MCPAVTVLLSIATTSCQWRMLSKDVPPRSIVSLYAHEWRAMGFDYASTIIS